GDAADGEEVGPDFKAQGHVLSRHVRQDARVPGCERVLTTPHPAAFSTAATLPSVRRPGQHLIIAVCFYIKLLFKCRHRRCGLLNPPPCLRSPGQQHTTVANPFEEAKPRVSEWTAKEIATISARLDKQLGPEYISARAGPGGTKVHYLTAEKCITLANEVFGFNGWSSSIQNIQVDFADENPQTQRVSIGLSVIVRITLRDGTFHEDIGYGSIENAKGKAMAFEKAKKEGTTDGMKRALRSFGNVLGNCIYDKDYVKQVTKIKAEPVKRFDQDNLHRHSDFVKRDMVRVEPTIAVTKVVPAIKAEPATAVADSFEDFLGGMLSSDGFEEIEAECL
ncbi:hypothetical protein EDB80DRAFT_397443, partial [Ilyonectria destructans]